MLRKLVVLAVATLAIGIGVIANAGAASAANDHTVPPPDVFQDVNPCTGDLVTITQTYTKSVFHFSEDRQGGTHLTGTLVSNIETSDGFSGHFTIWFGENASGDGEHFVGTFTQAGTLGNGSGQRVVVHGIGHVTVVGGEVVVEFEKFSLECKGKRA